MAVPARHGAALLGVSRSISFGFVLALLSFLIYASTVFVLPQVRNSRYCCEQSSVAAAISNVKYGARLGTLYSGVFSYLIERFDKPLEEALVEAQTPGIGLPPTPPGELFKTTRDGNGVGYPLVATVAFGLFGLHSWALTLLMLILMALSAAAFAWRFRGAVYRGVVALYFTTLTLMLFTPMVWDPSIEVNVPVGGIRYFSLVGILAIFHILLELMHEHPVDAGAGKRKSGLLAIQAGILVLAILVRGSALPMIGAISLVALAVFLRCRHEPVQRRVLLKNCKTMGVVSAGFLALVAVLVPPNYLTEGRFGTVIWQRVTESIGVNPAWPFPGTNEMFDCKKYASVGLEGGASDNNGVCIWFDYVAKHDIPIETISDKTFGVLYEVAMREAFFKIAARYPAEVLKTFIYYKPQMIVRSIQQSLVINVAGDQTKAVYPGGPPVVLYPPLAIALLLGSLAVALLFFSVEAIAIQDLARVAGLTLLSALFTIPAYLAAWAMPHTSGDLLFYCLFAIGLLSGTVVVYARMLMRSLFLGPKIADKIGP
jgi:hypothetical protein